MQILADAIPKAAHTYKFPVLQIPTSMYRDSWEDIEAGGCAVKDILAGHVDTARIWMEAREYRITECSIRSSCSEDREEG
jgi:hypothetical protein